MSSMTEEQLQSECVKWFRKKYSRKNSNPFAIIFAVPNGGSRNVLEAMNLQATGVLAGVTDLIMLYDKQAYFIEMKTATGTLSDSQKRFKLMLEMVGFGDNWVVIRSLEDFKAYVVGIIES